MTKQPWLKFYPADWRAEPSLRVCSVAARGLWMEMLCVMHDAEPRGSLVIGGQAVTIAQLAGLVGNITVRQAQALFDELAAARVFGRDDDGVVFSRRIRRDISKAEQDKANGARGGNPKLKAKPNRGVNPQDNQDDNGRDKAQKPEARSQKPDTKSLRDFGAIDAICDRFFAAYPKHAEEDGVRRELGQLLACGVPSDEIVAGAKRYAVECRGRAPEHISSPVRWLRDGRWKDGKPKPEVSLPTIRRDTPQGDAWDAADRVSGITPYWPESGIKTKPTEWPQPIHERASA